MIDVNAFKLKFEEAQQKSTSLLTDTLKEGFQEIFNTYPKLQKFSWNQYTPYFNDGDQCRFSVYDYISINDEDGENEEWEDSAATDISNLINSIDERNMHYMFGEGTVTISRDGTIIVGECDHE